MNITPWFYELLRWLLNSVTYLVPFIPAGDPTPHAEGKTTIFIISPSFTGPILYKRQKRYLENLGFNVIVQNFSNEMKSLHTAANELEKIIRRLPSKDITLVGLSSAGLVAFEYLNELGGWRDIKNVIYIATPFKGTNRAYLMYHTKTGRQLVPNSTYVKKNQEIKPKHLEKTYCIVAKSDEIVPRTSSVLKGAHFVEVPVIGHVTLHAFSEKTYDIIVEIARKHY